MKNNSTIYSCVFFVSFLLFHVLQAHAAEISSDRSANLSSAPTINSISADKKRLTSKIRRISKSIKLKEHKRSKLQKKIFSFDKKIRKLGLKKQKLHAKQAETQRRLDGLAQEKTTLAKDIEAAKHAMAQLVRAFYLMQPNHSAKALISGDNTAEVARMQVYHDYLIQEYLKQHQSLNLKYDDLAELDTVLDKELKLLDKLSQKNRKQTATLQKNYSQRSTSLAKLATEIKSGRSKINRLKADQKRLEKLAKSIAKLKLKQAKSSGISFAKHKGGLIWPVKGRVIAKFGRTRKGTRLKWRGMLIETNAGASVSAVAAGRVVFSDWLTGYGFVLIIEHGRGYMSLYAHNQQLLTNVGDSVQKNQKVALAGNSGRSGKPALYFEIRHKGKPVNPEKWIIARKSRR